VGIGVEERLVAVEECGIFYGTMVMDLAPVVIEKTEDSRGSEIEIENRDGTFQTAAFAADGVKQFAGNVKRVIVEFDADADGPGEEFFIDTADFGPAALDATHGIIHGDVVRRRPVLAHEEDVASVKGSIKLSQGVTRVSEITEIFVASDGIERCGKCG
jgi:hypothetical protein